MKKPDNIDDGINSDAENDGSGNAEQKITLIVNSDGSACACTFPEKVDDSKVDDDTAEPDEGTAYGRSESSISTSNNIIKLPKHSETILKALRENEDGDAYLFIKTFKDRYCYDHAADQWYYWNDHYWRLDKIDHTVRLVRQIVDMYTDQKIYEVLSAQKAEKDGDNKKAVQHKSIAKLLDDRIQSLGTMKRKNNIIKLARSGVGSLGITGEEWDQQPYLLPCKNGVVDLRTGEFGPGRPGDYLKTECPTKFESLDTPCPQWETFMLSVFGGRADMAAYMRRLLGYSIAGLTTEHIYPILWGADGRNGKGTMIEIVKHVLGGLAYKAPQGFLLQQGHQNNSSGPDANIMALRGARLVWCSETNEGDRLDTAKLKELVGGDTLSARPPYGRRQVEFRPTHTLFHLLNQRPRVPANDPALWKRVHLIPFEFTFIEEPDPKKPNQMKADKDLPDKLKTEASGILAWLVRGHIEWSEFGLLPPKSVCDATDNYRCDEDIIGHFIVECCITGDEGYRVTPKDLYAAYRKWCEEVGHNALAKKRFIDNMKDRFKIVKNDVIFFYGVGLLNG
jgi:putative DNA primase/helicase